MLEELSSESAPSFRIARSCRLEAAAENLDERLVGAVCPDQVGEAQLRVELREGFLDHISNRKDELLVNIQDPEAKVAAHAIGTPGSLSCNEHRADFKFMFLLQKC